MKIKEKSQHANGKKKELISIVIDTQDEEFDIEMWNGEE